MNRIYSLTDPSKQNELDVLRATASAIGEEGAESEEESNPGDQALEQAVKIENRWTTVQAAAAIYRNIGDDTSSM